LPLVALGSTVTALTFQRVEQGGGARAALDAYWDRVAQAAVFSPLQRTPLDRLLRRWTLDSSLVFIGLLWARKGAGGQPSPKYHALVGGRNHCGRLSVSRCVCTELNGEP
jgi:hypothetical protein